MFNNPFQRTPNPAPLGGEAALRTLFEQYTDLLKKGDFLATLDHIYPKLYEVIPRNIIEALATEQLDSMDDIGFEHTNIQHISIPLKLEGVEYRLLKYQFSMIAESADPSQVPADSTVLDMTYQLAEAAFGKHQVTLDRKNQTVWIDCQRQLYAIYDPAYARWYFLEKKKQNLPLLQQILPMKVMLQWEF